MALLAGAGGASAAETQGTATSRQRVDVIFVLDNSGSMRSNDPDRITHRVVSDFAAAQGRGARLGVVVFDDDARLAMPLTRASGRDAAEHWSEVIAQIDYSGQLTNSPDGIERALYELKTNGRPGADKAIIFITDGLVDTGERTRDVEKKRWLRESLAVEAERDGIRIYGIAFTDEADVELIQALALATGAEYYRVLAPDDIGEVLSRIDRSIASIGPDASPAASQVDGLAAGDDPALPPVASAPQDRTRGLVLLALGGGVGALVLLYPLLDRRRRTLQTRAAPIGPAQTPSRIDASQASSRQQVRPRASLVDVANVSADGLLPISIERRRTSIGRDESNDVVIRRDTVSSFHATIDFEDGYFYVEDHRSTNGCQLNGEDLTPNTPVQLKSGDRIDFAEFEFRFIIPDHEPRGRTVVLGGSVHPLSAAPVEPVSSAQTEAKTDVCDDPVAAWRAAFDGCLAAHLDKLRGVGAEHRAFVDARLAPDLPGILNGRLEGLIEAVTADGRGHELDVLQHRVHYTLCVLPGTIETAARFYREEYGGYAKRLVLLLEQWADEGRACEAICVVTLGMSPGAWISITLVPARDEGEAVEVMSFEFLSEDERRRALSLDIATVGRGS
jgi:pSer/pThr/pTyr-binding forkhead associated (FHA) protein/Mg-chelatase subunit ChlD